MTGTTHRPRTIPPWVRRYIGMPYARGGRGPDSFDCYGLLAWVARAEYGLNVPLHAGRDAAFAPGDPPAARRAAMAAELAGGIGAGWVRITAAEPGDGVLLRMGGLACHCGIMVTDRHCLHVAPGIATTLEDLGDLRWRRRVLGHYRFAGAAAP